MKKSIKILLISLCAFLLVVIILFVGIWSKFGQRITAALSVNKLSQNLYSLEYRGDYGLDEFISSGGAATDEALAEFLTNYLSGGIAKVNFSSLSTFACSSIVKTNSEIMFGRNFDWEDCSAMIIHTLPDNGYESVSTACLDFLGFGEDWAPDKSIADKFMSLAAIFVPLDGMNEKGLYVADLMAGDDEITNQSTSFADVTTTTSIRLLLDRAADVDDALDILRSVDMHSSISSAHHLAIADASGRSVVVEYVNNEMLVSETSVVTNHYLADSPKKDTGSQASKDRFDMLLQASKTANSEADVLSALSSAAQNGDDKTMWSVIYYPELKGADFYFKQDYKNPYGILLDNKDFWLAN